MADSQTLEWVFWGGHEYPANPIFICTQRWASRWWCHQGVITHPSCASATVAVYKLTNWISVWGNLIQRPFSYARGKKKNVPFHVHLNWGMRASLRCGRRVVSKSIYSVSCSIGLPYLQHPTQLLLLLFVWYTLSIQNINMTNQNIFHNSLPPSLQLHGQLLRTVRG